MKQTPHNPAGREGKPVHIDMSFDDAVRKMLATPPPKDPKTTKQAAKRRTKKR